MAKLQRFSRTGYVPAEPGTPAWKRDRKHLIASFGAEALYTPHFAAVTRGKPGFKVVTVLSQQLPLWEPGGRAAGPTCNRYTVRSPPEKIPEKRKIIRPLKALGHCYPKIERRLQCLSRTIELAQMLGVHGQACRRIRALVRLLWYGDEFYHRRWLAANVAARGALRAASRVPVKTQRRTRAQCSRKYQRSDSLGVGVSVDSAWP